MKKTTYAIPLLAGIAALVIAGCGGGSSSTGSESGGAGGKPASAETAVEGTVETADIEGLGTVLVNSEGMTLYEFTVDKGPMSKCDDDGCETIWPPLTVTGKPSAGEGAMASALGTSKRPDGSVQVTYEGHPLYTFSGDDAAGEANGNEVEGTWFALNEKGVAVKGHATGGGAEAEAEESSGGGGYGY